MKWGTCRRRAIALAAVLMSGMATKPASAHTKPVWIAGYYASWQSVPAPNEVNFSAITHLIYFTIFPNADGTLDPANQGVTDATAIALRDCAHKAGRKMLFCIGGDGAGDAFRAAIAEPARDVLVKNIVDWMTGHDYDGVDIDFEPMHGGDGPNFDAFVRELHDAMKKANPKSLLTAPVEGQGFPAVFAAVQDDIDQINLMTYVMAGSWSKNTWWDAALSNGGRVDTDGKPLPSCETYVAKWLAGGVKPEKLGIGISMGGVVWRGTDQPNVPVQGAIGMHGATYTSVMDRYYDPNFYHWDEGAKAAYLSIPGRDAFHDLFIPYEDARACREKINYVRKNKLGGLIVWELSEDYDASQPEGHRQPLMDAIADAIGGAGRQ